MTAKNKEHKEKLFEDEYNTVPNLLNDIVRARRKTDLAFRGISRINENNPKIQRVKNNNSTETKDWLNNEYQM